MSHNTRKSCPNKDTGCNISFGSREEVERHLESCFYKQCHCPQCNELILLKDLGLHVTQTCPRRALLCIYCKGHFSREDYERHRDDCDHKPLSCKFCGTKGILKMALKNHYETCPKFPKIKEPVKPQQITESPPPSECPQNRPLAKENGSVVNSKGDDKNKMKNFFDYFQSRIERIEKNVGIFEDRIKLLESNIINRCVEFDKENMANDKKIETFESNIFKKYHNLEQKCTIMEKRLMQPTNPSLKEIEPPNENRKPQNIKSKENPQSPKRINQENSTRLSTIIESMFPKGPQMFFRKLSWEIFFMPDKKNEGFWDERWFDSSYQDYEYRCYAFPNEDKQHIDIKVWVGLSTKFTLSWPPKMTILLGILDPNHKEEELLLDYKVLESPRKFMEVYKEGSGYFLFEKFVSFRDLENSDSRLLNNSSLNLLAYVGFQK